MSTPHPPGVPCDGWPPMSQASSTPDPAPWAAVPACSLPPAPGAPSSPTPSSGAPSQPQAGPTASGPSSSSAGGSNSSSRQRGTVLVVDDMAINRVVLGHMVRKAGLDVVEATNGQEAIEQVATHPPGHFQCILMDLQMPVVDGWQATQQIRAWEAGYARANSEATLPGPGVGSPPGAPYRMQTYMTDDMGGGVMSHALLSRSTTYMTDELAGGDGRLGTCAAPSRSSTCVRDEAGCQAGRGFGRSGTCMTDELQQWGSMGTPGQLPSSGALGQGSEDVLDIRGRSGPSAGGGSSGSSMHTLLPLPPGGVLPAAAQVAMPIAAAVRAAGARSSHFPALEQPAAAAAAEAAVAGEPVAAGSPANPGSQDLARHQPAPAAAAQQLPLGVGVTHFVQQRQQQREQQSVWYGVRHNVLPTQQLLLPLGALRLSASDDAGALAVPASAAAAAAVMPATGPAVTLDLGPWRQQVLQAPPGVQRPTRPAPGLGPLSEGSTSGSGSSSSTSGHSGHAPMLPGISSTPAHHVLAAGRSSRSGLQPGELAEELGFLDDACEPFLLRGCHACNLSAGPGAPAVDHDIDDDGTLSDSFSERSGASTPRGVGFRDMHDAGLAATLSLLGSGLLEPDATAYARAASRLPVQEVESEDDDAAPGAALGAAVDGGPSQPQSGQLPLVHDSDDVAAVGHEEEAADDDQPRVEGTQVASGPAGPPAAGSGVQHGQPPHSNPFRVSSPSLLQTPTTGSEAGPAPATAPAAQLARERLLALMVEAPGPLERPDGAFSFARMHSTPWSGFGALATPPSSAIQLRLGTTCPLGVGPSHATSHHTTSSWGRSHSAVLSGAGPAAVRVPIVACTAEVLGGPPVNCPSFVETTPPSSPPMTAAQHALSCGVDECVRKPLSFQELCGLLSKYIPAWAEDHADMAPAAGGAAAATSSAGPSRSTALRPADVRQRPPLLRRQYLQVLPEVQAAGEAEGPSGQPAEPPGAASQQQH